MNLGSSGEEYNSHGEHVVEIPAHAPPVIAGRRRYYTGVVVVLGLALVGILIAGTIAHDNAVQAQDEAIQREELRAGWSTLGALAAEGAQAVEAAQPTAAPVPASTTAQPSVTYQQVMPAAPATVVVVNGSLQPTPNFAAAPPVTAYPIGVPLAMPAGGAAIQGGGQSTFGVPPGTLAGVSSAQAATSGGAANSSQVQSNGAAPPQSLPTGTASSSIPAIPNGTVQAAPPSRKPSINGATSAAVRQPLKSRDCGSAIRRSCCQLAAAWPRLPEAVCEPRGGIRREAWLARRIRRAPAAGLRRGLRWAGR